MWEGYYHILHHLGLVCCHRFGRQKHNTRLLRNLEGSSFYKLSSSIILIVRHSLFPRSPPTPHEYAQEPPHPSSCLSFCSLTPLSKVFILFVYFLCRHSYLIFTSFCIYLPPTLTPLPLFTHTYIRPPLSIRRP